MLNQFITFLIIISILNLTFGGSILAQTNQTKQELKTEKVKEKIKKLGTGEKVKIKVELFNQNTYQGYLSEANAGDFVVVDENGNKNTLKYSEVNKVGGKNFSNGTKIAIGVGIGVAILMLFLLSKSLDDK